MTCRCGSAATQHLCKPCNDQLDAALDLAVVQQNYQRVVIEGTEKDVEVFVHPCDEYLLLCMIDYAQRYLDLST